MLLQNYLYLRANTVVMIQLATPPVLLISNDVGSSSCRIWIMQAPAPSVVEIHTCRMQDRGVVYESIPAYDHYDYMKTKAYLKSLKTCFHVLAILTTYMETRLYMFTDFKSLNFFQIAEDGHMSAISTVPPDTTRRGQNPSPIDNHCIQSPTLETKLDANIYRTNLQVTEK